MVLALAFTFAGLALLWWSADKFVLGAVAVAKLLGMSPLLVGMIVIGFGTSAPELVVSAFAAAGGDPGLALGNAMGSNIANIGLVLGVAAIIVPIAVTRGVMRREIPQLILFSLLLGFTMLDGAISRLDALILLGVLVAQLFTSLIRGRREQAGYATTRSNEGQSNEGTIGDPHEDDDPPMSPRAAWGWAIGGMVLLVIASRILVGGATEVAERLGWSDLVIGLTVVAIGTSAPELASSIAAARRRQTDLVLGNIIGSNIFNTLAVVGLAGVIAPSTIEPAALTRDLPVLLAFTAALAVMGFARKGNGSITRVEGILLLLGWSAYTVILIATAV